MFVLRIQFSSVKEYNQAIQNLIQDKQNAQHVEKNDYEMVLKTFW